MYLQIVQDPVLFALCYNLNRSVADMCELINLLLAINIVKAFILIFREKRVPGNL